MQSADVVITSAVEHNSDKETGTVKADGLTVDRYAWAHMWMTSCRVYCRFLLHERTTVLCCTSCTVVYTTDNRQNYELKHAVGSPMCCAGSLVTSLIPHKWSAKYTTCASVTNLHVNGNIHVIKQECD